MPPKKQSDRHKSGFLVRFPDSYRKAFEKLKAKTRRTYTTDAQIAMDAHLKANGIPVPKGEK
jgi:hypothetical protein